MDNALGDLLRRSRLGPPGDGHPVADRPGWRREDVAARAGISTSYYAQLEQGRRRRPSSRTVQGLAEALRLGDEDRQRLYELAGTAPRCVEGHRASSGGPVPPSLHRALEALEHLPASILDAGLDVVRANARWQGLHAGFSRPGNLAAMVFLDPIAGEFYLDWRQVAETALARLRVASSSGHQAAHARVGELCGASPSFRRRWRAGDEATEPGSVKVRVRHPALGHLGLRHDVFTGPRSQPHGLHVLFPIDRQSAALVALLDLYHQRC